MARNTAFDKKSRIAKRNMRIEKKMAKTIAIMIGNKKLMSSFGFCFVLFVVFIYICKNNYFLSPSYVTNLL
jgi:hypothetical protein